MTVKLEAPYPSIQTVTILPNPRWNDSESLTNSINIHRTMRGNTYTYVKTTNNRRRLFMNFNITRMKGLELQAFIKSYFSSTLKLTDHLGVSWVGKFTSNPFNFSTPGPAEYQDIQLEFEGTQL